ncbi:SurA N-terminal domain-containing protein [Coraliomargarita parva]|uniref:SurA N-terminal domain-containing protein n=1 Tax=Coraliomargarita parva TaxID=3014050 RepID=UPI0022B4BE10|nr:SurA N-terminal domain-containing protein [Coraliomargarita parva]
MISWIQKHLIRHGRWIFLCLLGIVIVAFVFTIGNTPGCTTNRSAYREQKFYEYDLNSQRDMQLLSQKASMSQLLRTGRPVQNEQQFQNELMSRIALLHLADEIGIPAPSQAELTEFIKTRRAFAGPDGTFSADAYTSFVDSMESNPRVQSNLIVAVLEEDYRLEMLGETLAGPGYMLPSETMAQAQRENTSYTLASASLSYAEFKPEIEPAEEDLKSFYEENKLRYQIPERIQASYVVFPTSDYMDEVEAPTESQLREHFMENRARLVDAYKAAQKAAPTEQLAAEAKDAEADEAEVGFEDVKASVLSDWILERAGRQANHAADSFAYTLFDQGIQRNSAAFNKLLNDSGLSLKPIQPYTESGIRQRRISSAMLESAFDLNNDRYYSDAYALDDGGYGVLIYEGRIDPEIPAYEAVATEVQRDYLVEMKRELFNEKGVSLKAELEAKLTEGADFVETAKSLGLEAQSYETFKGSDAPRELSPSLIQASRGMAGGELSAMITSGGQGSFVYVIAKEVPEMGAVEEDDTTQNFLKRYNAMISSSSLMNELITNGLPEPETSADSE